MVIGALANVNEDAFLAENHRPYPNDPFLASALDPDARQGRQSRAPDSPAKAH
jgi:hypothetical protein